MTSREFEGRTAAEAAIKACEELGVTRSALNYQVVSETGEGLQDRRVVISAEANPEAASSGGAFMDEDSPSRDRRPARGRGSRDRPEGRRGERSERGDRSSSHGRSPRGRGGNRQDGRRGGHDGGRDRGRGRNNDDKNIENLLNVEAVPAEVREPKPEVDGEVTGRAEAGREVLNEILRLADFELQASLVEDGDREIHFDLRGEDEARIIGKKGEALLALQFLANRIVSRKAEGNQHLVLDAADYRNRRKEALVELARQLAAKALEEQKVVRLSPMSAHDRRIFHITLEDREDVSTRSEGDGLYRPLLIVPEAD